MPIQRITIAPNPQWPGRARPVWALVDGPVAIRPAFEIAAARGWVVCHVPSGLYIAVVESKEAARSLAAALRDVLPATGTLGVRPEGEVAAPIRTAILAWHMGQVW